MRISSALGLLLLVAACGGGDGSGSGQGVAPSPGSTGSSGSSASNTSVSCAIGGASSLAENCTLEAAQVEGAPVLVIRHPDGGFRRFAVKDGNIAEADGAEQAVVTRSGSSIGIAVGSDRYRLSASQLGNGQ